MQKSAVQIRVGNHYIGRALAPHGKERFPDDFSHTAANPE
jgi:hypothetical protein